MNCAAFLAEIKVVGLHNYCEKLLYRKLAFDKLRLQILDFSRNHDSAASILQFSNNSYEFVLQSINSGILTVGIFVPSQQYVCTLEI